MEIGAAYTPLANQGIYVEPLAVLEVRDSDGNTIFEDRSHKKIALPEATAYLITDMLRGVIMRGTGRAAMLDRPAAGKTGTTSDFTNAWFIGYTPDLLAAVWIGNDSQKIPVTIDNVALGSWKAAEIWGTLMRSALSQTPPSDFIPPAGIISGVEICVKSGDLAGNNCPETKFETYLAGTEPTKQCTLLHTDVPEGTDPANLIPETPVPGLVTPTPNPLTPLTATPANKKRRQVIVKICSESGLLATLFCPEDQVSAEMFVEGEEPTAYCNIHPR